MKLSDIKSQLLERHFTEGAAGLSLTALAEALDQLGVSAELSALETSKLSDVSKTFRRFVDGREAVLSIVEDDDRALFTAHRVGRKIHAKDHTCESAAGQIDLNGVKSALKQAQALSDEIQFHVQVLP